MKNSKVYPFIVCFICTLTLFCTGGFSTSSFSVYIPFIRDINGFSNAQTTFLITARGISALLSLGIVDWYIKKLGAVKGIVISLIIEAIGTFLYAVSDKYAVYVIAAAITGIGYSLGGIVTISIVINIWFVSLRGFATGICTTGTGIATVVVPPIVTLIINRFSLSTSFMFESVVCIIVALIVVLFLKDSPDSLGIEAYYDQNKNKQNINQTGSDTDGLGKLFTLSSVFFLGIMAYIVVGIIPPWYTEIGFDSLTVSLLLSMYGFSLIIGKILFGYGVDRFGTFETALICTILIAVGAIFELMSNTNYEFMAFVAVFIAGFGLPVATVGLASHARDFSSEKTLARNMRNMQSSYTIGSMVCGIMVGKVADATGSYRVNIILSIVFVLIYYVLISVVYLRQKNK